MSEKTIGRVDMPDMSAVLAGEPHPTEREIRYAERRPPQERLVVGKDAHE